jgi:hypothetical protein
MGKSVDYAGQRIAAVQQRDTVVYEVRLYRKGAWLVDGHPHASFADAQDRCDYLVNRQSQARPEAQRQAPAGGIAFGDYRPDQRPTEPKRPAVHRHRNAASLSRRIKAARAELGLTNHQRRVRR